MSSSELCGSVQSGRLLLGSEFTSKIKCIQDPRLFQNICMVNDWRILCAVGRYL